MTGPAVNSPPKPEREAVSSDRPFPKAGLAGYWELTKPRLSLLSVITALVGYLAARPETFFPVLHVFVGTSLAAGGAAVLNQWMERATDARMSRTRDRPIPAGTVTPGRALGFGLMLSVAGVGHLGYWLNGPAAGLALLTIVTYVVFYTPLKSRSGRSLEVGAVSGALPPLIGWAAAEGGVSGLGWILFGILFFWQMPHFLAIAWLYRDDYASVNFPMLTVVDVSGDRAARYSLICSALLAGVTLLPFFLGWTGWFFLAAAVAGGGGFLWTAIRFLQSAERTKGARQLFYASILHLPLILGALVIDRLFFGN